MLWRLVNSNDGCVVRDELVFLGSVGADDVGRPARMLTNLLFALGFKAVEIGLGALERALNRPTPYDDTVPVIPMDAVIRQGVAQSYVDALKGAKEFHNRWGKDLL